MIPVRITPAVKVFMIACAAVFLLNLLGEQWGGHLAGFLALIPSECINHLHLWQLVTYSFVHTEPMQLVLSLLMLAFIGSELEGIWGSRRFVQFYLFCTALAGGFYLLLVAFFGGGALGAPMLGSNAPVYGLLVAYGILYKERMMLFMMFFPMKAKHFIWILAAVEFLNSVSYGRNGLSSLAHLGGMGAGFIYLYGRATWSVLKTRRDGFFSIARSVKKSRGSNHLKLVKGDKPDSERKTWH